jgi:hypothetical protein
MYLIADMNDLAAHILQSVPTVVMYKEFTEVLENIWCCYVHGFKFKSLCIPTFLYQNKHWDFDDSEF